jgi:hypothetical protein
MWSADAVVVAREKEEDEEEQNRTRKWEKGVYAGRRERGAPDGT